MKKKYLMALIALVFSGCSTLKVQTDYDTEYNFTKNTTYAVVYNVKESDNTLTYDRIKTSIKDNINEKGYKEVSKENADLVLVFHVQVTQMSDIRTDYERIGYGGYGYGGGWGYGGYGGGGTMVVPRSVTYRWKEGQLIIDAYNPKTNKIVWRGIVKDEISNASYTPEENIEYINDVVTKVLKSLPNSGV